MITGRYQLEQKLGQGGMGVVHRALDRLTGETVALKRVTAAHKVRAFAMPTAEQTPDALQLALTREFQVLASLRHPHIISVLDYGFDAEQQPFYTMNYLPEAQTLLDAGHGRSQPEKLNLIAQVLQALIYLHRRGVLHRDLKPENILVSAGVVQVLDFGLAASGGEAGASSGSEGGTAQYAAPELWDGQPYTVRADLFALGIILAQLLTGRHPFGPLDHALIDRILDEDPNLDGVEPKLATVLQQLLAKEPAQRYPNAEVVLTALAEASGQPAPAESTAIRESFLQTATFVGREAEMLALTTALHEAAAGHGSGWLIGGESGIGKSRLISELRIQALVLGFQVLHGQGVQDSGGLPMQFWREPLRHLLVTAPVVDDLTASVLLPIVPEIAQLLGRPVAPAPELEVRAAQLRLFTTLAQLFWRAAQPVLLILEDLHWAKESLLPVPYVLQAIAERRLIILGTYRSDERPHLPEKLPGLKPLILNRLRPQDMAALSQAMLGESGQRPEVLTLLQQEAEGNAFFAVEVVRELAARAGRLGDIGHMRLPEKLLPNGIQDIVERRLSKIPEQARQLLLKAAVAGQELEVAVLQQLAPEVPVEHWWLPLCAEAALVDFQPVGWRFSHAKIRDGLLIDLATPQLAALHQQVAEAIEQVHPDEADQAMRLAYHWGAAGNGSKELKFILIAGKHAAAQYAHREALQYLERALALCPADDLEQKYSILVERLKPQMYLGERAAQSETLEQLSALANLLNAEGKRVEVLFLQIQSQENQGRFIEAEALGQQTYTLANKLGDEPQVARVLVRWAIVLARQGKTKPALEKAFLAEAIFQRLGDRRGEADTASALGLIFFKTSERDKSQTHIEKCLTIAQEINYGAKIQASLNNLGLVYLGQGAYELAESYLEQALVLARKIGDIPSEMIAIGNWGRSIALRGAYALAREPLQQYIALSRQLNHRALLGHGLDDLGEVFRQTGDFANAKSHYRQALQSKHGLGDAQSEAVTWNNLGHLAFTLGDFEEALTAYQNAEALQQGIDFTPTLVETWAGLAEAYRVTGQPATAQPYAEQAWQYLSEHGLEDVWKWGRSCLKLYRFFRANADARAEVVLGWAGQAVQSRANKFSDPLKRAVFLEEVPDNREIIQLTAPV